MMTASQFLAKRCWNTDWLQRFRSDTHCMNGRAGKCTLFTQNLLLQRYPASANVYHLHGYIQQIVQYSWFEILDTERTNQKNHFMRPDHGIHRKTQFAQPLVAGTLQEIEVGRMIYDAPASVS